MRERIEQIAREEVKRTHRGIYVDSELFQIEVGMCHSAIIAALKDKEIGYKEALEWVHNRPCGSCDAFPPCEGLPNGTCNGDPVDSCTCPCHTAEAKLKELEELSK